ncbi:hypothetical protein BDV12DRAFT_167760 [Aspergillus spectabilis]
MFLPIHALKQEHPTHLQPIPTSMVERWRHPSSRTSARSIPECEPPLPTLPSPLGKWDGMVRYTSHFRFSDPLWFSSSMRKLSISLRRVD